MIETVGGSLTPELSIKRKDKEKHQLIKHEEKFIGNEIVCFVFFYSEILTIPLLCTLERTGKTA